LCWSLRWISTQDKEPLFHSLQQKIPHQTYKYSLKRQPVNDDVKHQKWQKINK
jgi:hypothetical protein